MAKWEPLRDSGAFDEDRARLSCMALPEYLPQVKPCTLPECIKGQTPTLATVRKYHGEQIAVGALSVMLAETAELLNVGNNLNATQVKAISEMIMADFYWFTIADFKTLFRMGVKGEFGKIYERLDANVIYEWLNQYNESRAALAEQASMSNAQQVAMQEGGEPIPEWMSKWIDGFAKHQEAKARAEQKKSSLQYTSLRHYCDLNDLDYDLSLADWVDIWTKDYNERQPDMSLEEWVDYCKAQTLHDINNPK